MASVTFFEKPGCATNARQRHMLESAGHQLVVRNLLAQPWSAAELRSYFASLPVKAWFNPAAPAVKSGEVDPATVGADAALELMLANPLLIRRPLIESGGERCAGFDSALVADLLGHAAAASDGSCSRPGPLATCSPPDKTMEAS